jgi:hypothetical protein
MQGNLCISFLKAEGKGDICEGGHYMSKCGNCKNLYTSVPVLIL